MTTMGPSSGKFNERGREETIEVVIGLGGNQGPIVENFTQVVDRLAARFGLVQVSRLYQTEPLGPAQPDYLNAALLIQSHLELDVLLVVLQKLELELGRVRLEKWGPRTVDLDILWSPGKIISSSSLTVPHLELRNRAFALLPLLDVYVAARDPRDGELYRDVLERLPSSSVRVIARGSWWKALPAL